MRTWPAASATSSVTASSFASCTTVAPGSGAPSRSRTTSSIGSTTFAAGGGFTGGLAGGAFTGAGAGALTGASGMPPEHASSGATQTIARAHVARPRRTMRALMRPWSVNAPPDSSPARVQNRAGGH